MLGRIFLQFCSREDIKGFERRHYVRAMSAQGRTRGSKLEGEPRGHHGQQIHYLIWYETGDGWQNVGVISGGSAVYATASRDAFFGINKENREAVINGIIDNTVFRLEFHEHNLASRILALWRKEVCVDWQDIYKVTVYGFETFVELADLEDGRQRLGSLYLADNWTRVGKTAGNTKNHIGKGLDGALRGKPFSRENVPVKLIFCKWIKPFCEPIGSVYRSSWRAVTEQEKAIALEKQTKRKRKTLEAIQKMIVLEIEPQLALWSGNI